MIFFFFKTWGEAPKNCSEAATDGWEGGAQPLPPNSCSFAAIFGGFAPSFKVKKSRNLLLGNRLRYGDGGEVRKDLSWYNKTFVTLGLYLYFTPIRQ